MYSFLRGALVSALLSVPAIADQPVVNVYSWADYIEPGLVDEFEKEFGIHVNYDTYESAEIVDSKLMAGGTGYDVIVHDAQLVGRLLPIGVFQKLDFSKIPNAQYIDPAVSRMTEGYDPGNAHMVPYMWGSVGYAYNVDMVRKRMPDAPIGTGDFIFNPKILSKFADCGISFLDSPVDVIPMALAYLGHDINSVDPKDLDEVATLLKGVRPYIKYFSSTKLMQDMPNREICVAISWSGDYAQAQKRASDAKLDVHLGFAVPSSGAPLWVDVMVVPKDAPHKDNAYKLINFLMRPQVMARISNYVYYANGNLASKAFIKPELLNDPSIYPPPEVMAVLKAKKILSPKEERMRTRLWARFKTGMWK